MIMLTGGEEAVDKDANINFIVSAMARNADKCYVDVVTIYVCVCLTQKKRNICVTGQWFGLWNGLNIINAFYYF